MKAAKIIHGVVLTMVCSIYYRKHIQLEESKAAFMKLMTGKKSNFYYRDKIKLLNKLKIKILFKY
jgi:hypothetical protein